MCMVNGHNESLSCLELGYHNVCIEECQGINVSEKCVKMVFQKVLTMEEIAQETKVNKEEASVQLQNWQRKSQLKSDFVFF